MGPGSVLSASGAKGNDGLVTGHAYSILQVLRAAASWLSLGEWWWWWSKVQTTNGLKKRVFFQSEKKNEPFFHEMFHAFHVLLKVRKVNDGFLGIGGKAPIAARFRSRGDRGFFRQRFDAGTSLVMTGGRMK